MKSVIIVCMLALLTSIASAEVYKWEDANGVHFTDNPLSVPEKYREQVYAATKAQTKNTTPQVGGRITQLNGPVVTQENQAAIYQANLEQQRRAAEAMRQQQTRALTQSTKSLEGAFQSLARFMVFWVMIGLFIFITWVSTIVDIVSSEFTTPSNKTLWMLLVILLPLLGMVLYYIFGLSQKCNSLSYKEKEREELLARLNPRSSKDKDFSI